MKDPNDVDRLVRICSNLRHFQLFPSLTISQVSELTGLSRTRVCALLDSGVFSYGHETSNRRILLQTVHKYFSRRVSRLLAAGRFPRTKQPKLLQLATVASKPAPFARRSKNNLGS